MHEQSMHPQAMILHEKDSVEHLQLSQSFRIARRQSKISWRNLRPDPIALKACIQAPARMAGESIAKSTNANQWHLCGFFSFIKTPPRVIPLF